MTRPLGATHKRGRLFYKIKNGEVLKHSSIGWGPVQTVEERILARRSDPLPRITLRQFFKALAVRPWFTF